MHSLKTLRITLVQCKLFHEARAPYDTHYDYIVYISDLNLVRDDIVMKKKQRYHLTLPSLCLNNDCVGKGNYVTNTYKRLSGP